MQKTLKVDSSGKQHVQELRSTEEAGTSTVTYKGNKVGVTKTVQGSKEGAWLVDTTEHVVSLATKADQARQELTACMYTDFESAQEDIKAGRRYGPILATAARGHFSYWRGVQQGSLESMAVAAHVGLLGQEFTDQIPLIMVDPNQHPMYQINGTLEMVTKLKDEVTKLWEAMTKIAEATHTLSDNCHTLQVDTVVRAAGATHSASGDAKQSDQEKTLSMADRLEVETAAKKTKAAALEEELDKARLKSPPLSPRAKQHEAGVSDIPSLAHPKATGCVPKEEQPESKRQQTALAPEDCKDADKTGKQEDLQSEGSNT